MKPLARRDFFLPSFLGLLLLAWAALWIWERSPYARYIQHGEPGAICLTGAAEPVLLQAALYLSGWMLMTTAMMLPTTLPLIEAFRRLTRNRRDRLRLVLLLVTGYLAVWLAVGFAAHALDLGLHEALEHSGWLQINNWVFGAAVLLVAGLFQFSALKYRCLDKCRAPMSFVIEHWRGGNARGQALALGAHHGLFCVGCCWALMLLMFAVGTGSVAWMLVLGAVMALEKNAPWGRKLSAPLGLLLLASSALIVLHHAGSWPV